MSRMEPIKVSHTIVPQRPCTAPPVELTPCSPAGLRSLRRRGLNSVDLQIASAPTGYAPIAMPSPSQLRRPSTPSALGFGLDFAQAPASSGCDVGMAPPTPTNSSRRNSDMARLMMPRSSRSMRHNVLQARTSEEVDTLSLDMSAQLPIRPATSCGTPSGLQRRAGFGGVMSLGSDAMQSSPVAPFVANGLCTPKNSDRRDMAGSVETMTPLWRGSAAEVVPVVHFASSPPTTFIASPMRMGGYPTSSVVPSCSQAIPMAPLVMSTPKNSERLSASTEKPKMMLRTEQSPFSASPTPEPDDSPIK